MGIRKNQAALSAVEISAFVAAVKALKANGKYDGFVAQHRAAFMAAPNDPAHRGPAFLPWHREFLRRFERELQAIDPTVNLPYWDWTVDRLPTASLWQANFMGGDGTGPGGRVENGPFAFSTGEWNLTVRDPGDSAQYLSRAFGEMGALPTTQSVSDALKVVPYDAAPWNGATSTAASFRSDLELVIHNPGHMWVGGSMMAMSSPNDPVFWLHHCNIDRLWAQWQREHIDQEYLPPAGTPNVVNGHRIDDPMPPWAAEPTPPTPRSVLDYHALGYSYDDEPRSAYAAVFAEGSPGKGIGGFDLASATDRAFAFDYDHSSKHDHIALYRPGTGTFWILKNKSGAFSPVFAEGSPGKGIGGFDLASDKDRAFAFDYNSTGKLDHLVLYRPGTGTLWILKNNAGAFSAVYAEGSPGKGIGGFDIASAHDRVFAFDYNSTGKLDHLVLYRPGTGTLWILKNNGGAFSPVYAEGSPGKGIGGFDLASRADRVFAFDYNSTGKLDHLALYRPGTGTMWILKNKAGAFSPVYAEGSPGHGIGGFDLASSEDRAFAIDYDGSGKLDYMALYRPGTGTFWVLKNNAGAFSPVIAEGCPGHGVGGYDLASPADRAFAFDYAGQGLDNYLTLYRPGTGTMWMLKRNM